MNDELLMDGWTDTQNFGVYNIIPFVVAGHKICRSFV